MIHTYATALNLFLSGGSVNKESACNAEDPDSILGQEAPLEKEMATHFTILAREVPWTEDRGTWWATVPGVTRVGHDSATEPPELPDNIQDTQ